MISSLNTKNLETFKKFTSKPDQSWKALPIELMLTLSSFYTSYNYIYTHLTPSLGKFVEWL